MTDRRLIPHRDQDALNALRLGSVVLDRRGEVWQVLMVQQAAHGPTRGWFRLLAGGQAHGAGAVAENGPLRVLYDRSLDIPEHVTFCAHCLGMTDEPGTITPCTVCGGMGWMNGFDGKPLTLAEAMGLAASIVPVRAAQGILPPESLLVGMGVLAEPKPAHTASRGPVRGIVADVQYEDGEALVIVDGMSGQGPIIRQTLPARVYSFRPLDE